MPLLISDLPAFCRWRGEPDLGLAGARAARPASATGSSSTRPSGAARPRATHGWRSSSSETAVSDIAWGRTRAWRGRLAELWPGIGKAKTLSVTGPRADALLLAGWLRSRLRRPIELTHRAAKEITRVAVDGEPVAEPLSLRPSASDLLSEELDVFTRDRIYEAAVASSSA